MPTTSNFGWTTPADTDLVKDGAAAIRTLGNGIDTSLLDLKGGTTNQVLAKNSNTDLDFKWVADATGIPATIFDAKGDIIAATAADTADRLAVGTNGHVLTADSTTATGLKWAAATATKNYSLLSTTNLTGAATITVSGISNADSILVLVNDALADAQSVVSVRFNSDTTSANYQNYGVLIEGRATYGANMLSTGSGYASTSFIIGRAANSSGGSQTVQGGLTMFGANASGVKIVNSIGTGAWQTGDVQRAFWLQGVYKGTSTISSVSILSSVGNFTAGSVSIYTSA